MLGEQLQRKSEMGFAKLNYFGRLFNSSESLLRMSRARFVTNTIHDCVIHWIRSADFM